ncbi:LysE family translocator [Polycladidibacter stylochi]|uniref:LysE family translocator n=1 Tax=Polycladidibacter stylochi TaxID=1807766 RepID=UPI000AFA54B7|nr:LysE family transporter [Pseudovibrio stylochi]
MFDSTTMGAFASFVIMMTGTPGPGNLTFMAIGSANGYRKTFPLIIAAMLGGIVLHAAVGLGLGQLFSGSGPFVTMLKLVGFTYMAYLAYRIATIKLGTSDRSRQLSMWESFLIHPLSPKTWAMSLVAFTTYFAANGQAQSLNTLVVIISFSLGALVFHSLWALSGASILLMLGQGKTLRIVTVSLSSIMLGTTAYSLFMTA